MCSRLGVGVYGCATIAYLMVRVVWTGGCDGFGVVVGRWLSIGLILVILLVRRCWPRPNGAYPTSRLLGNTSTGTAIVQVVTTWRAVVELGESYSLIRSHD